MSYSKRTTFFSIPFMGQGDVMTEEDNSHQMNVIDRLLYANNFGLLNYLIEQGRYVAKNTGNNFELKIYPSNSEIIPTQNDSEEDSSSDEENSSEGENNIQNQYQEVVIKKGSENFSLAGVLNHRLFYREDVLTVSNLNYNNVYYLYVQEMQQDSIDYFPWTINIAVYQSRQEINKTRIPLCVVTTTSENIEIELNVDGKFYSQNVNVHISDNTNPHGRVMIQDQLNINDKILIDGYKSLGNLYTSFLSNNEEYEISFPENKKIVFATAYAQDLTVNKIAWHIDEENRKIIFNTSGAENVKINVKLDLENDEVSL